MAEKISAIWETWAETPEEQIRLTGFGDRLQEKHGASVAIAGYGEKWWQPNFGGEIKSIRLEELVKLVESGEVVVESVLRIQSRREGGELPSMYDSVIKVAEKLRE